MNIAQFKHILSQLDVTESSPGKYSVAEGTRLSLHIDSASTFVLAGISCLTLHAELALVHVTLNEKDTTHWVALERVTTLASSSESPQSVRRAGF